MTNSIIKPTTLIRRSKKIFVSTRFKKLKVIEVIERRKERLREFVPRSAIRF